MNTKYVTIGVVVVIVVAIISAGLYIGNNDNTEDDSGPISVTDSSGNTLVFEQPVEKVVVYSKYIAEAMILMGATDKAVGVTTTIKNDSNYAKYFEDATEIASKPTEGLDVVQTLTPDVVISHNTNDNSQLLAHGYKVLEIGASKINEVHDDITILGKILGMEEEAQRILDWFNPYYEAVLSQTGYSETEFALESASATRLTFCNPTSTPGVLLDYVKGSNVFTDTSTTYSYPEGSTLIEMNPDVIMVVTYNSNWNDAYLSQYIDTINNRVGWGEISAVKNGDVYMVSNDIIGGIRSVIGAMFILSFTDDRYADIYVAEMVDEYNAIAGTSFNNQMVYS